MGAEKVKVFAAISGFISALGGRRFLLCLGAGFTTTLLTWYGKIDGNIYRDVILATLGAFIAGNTYQKVKGASRGEPAA